MSSKHLLTTNTTSASRHSRNNCGQVHPFPNACCRRTMSLQILGELVSTHLCVWLSEEITNKILAKTCDVCGKTDGQILLVSTGSCNSGWETVASGYVQPFSGITEIKTSEIFRRNENTVSCQGLHNAFDFPPVFAVSSNEWDALEFWPRIMELCEIAWCRLKQDVFLCKVKRFRGRDGHPYSCSGKQAGEDQANTFSDTPNERCPLSLVVPVLTPHPGLALQMQIIKCLGEKEDQFCFKISSTLPWCSVLKAPSELLLGQPSPGSTTFVSVRAEAEPGEAPAALETPSSSSQAAQPVCCKKPPIHHHPQYY